MNFTLKTKQKSLFIFYLIKSPSKQKNSSSK